MQKLINGGILITGRRTKPWCIGSFSHLSQSQRNNLSQKIMESAVPLSPYDTLELNYGDQKLVLYRVENNVLVATLNSPKFSPQTIADLLPAIRQVNPDSNTSS